MRISDWSSDVCSSDLACAGGDADADQPILLAAAPDAANGARNILLVDGVWREEALAFDRAFHLLDEERISEARLTWKAVATQHGIDRRSWRSDERRVGNASVSTRSSRRWHSSHEKHQRT